jgi:hypothetical protein
MMVAAIHLGECESQGEPARQGEGLHPRPLRSSAGALLRLQSSTARMQGARRLHIPPQWRRMSAQSKLIDVGSEYGIEGGRISKLNVMHKGTVTMSYDRGWEQTPKSWKDKAALKDLLAGFPRMGEGDDGLSAKTQKGIKSGRGF